MANNSQVLSLLRQTVNRIHHKSYEELPCLMSGNGSLILFLAYYYCKVEQDEKVHKSIERLLALMLQQTETLPLTSSLASGYSGIGWLLLELQLLGMLEHVDDIVSPIVEIILLDAENDIATGNYDFLYGLPGKYLFLRKVIDTSDLHAAIKCDLESKTVVDFEHLRSSVNSDNLNMGLAHGIPGVGLFLTQLEILPQKLWEEIIEILRVHCLEKTGKTHSIFANEISLCQQLPPSESRFAWCYGDLGVLYAVHKMNSFYPSSVLNEVQQKTFSACLERTINNAHVNCLSTDGLLDIGFCHGLSGIYHLQRKINCVRSVAQQCELLPEATWRTGLLNSWQLMLDTMDCIPPSINATHDHFGLLEGICGAGLVGISSITGDSHWDECLMLG